MTTTELDELKKHFDTFTREIEKLSKKMETRIKEVEEKQKEWNSIQEKISQNLEKAKSKIVFDVGGQRFAISKATLLEWKGSYFDVLLSSGRWSPDEDGSYFIDRDPTYFGFILNFLRTKTINFISLSQKDIGLLKIEFDYFQIPFPQCLEWSSQYCGSNLTLSQNNKIVTKAGGGSGWNAGVLGTSLMVSFKVKVLERAASGDVMVGFSPQSTFQINGSNYSTSGWYIYVNTGALYSQNGDSGRVYRSAISNSSVIEAKLDVSQKQIAFVVDGVNHGVAFQNVNINEPVYPALDIYEQNVKIEIVE